VKKSCKWYTLGVSERTRCKGYIYLDTGSYDKMLEWSGGFFRNFLVKYAESNNMHKKALWVKRKIDKARDKLGEIPLDYYMAFCNDAYWHGLLVAST